RENQTNGESAYRTKSDGVCKVLLPWHKTLSRRANPRREHEQFLTPSHPRGGNRAFSSEVKKLNRLASNKQHVLDATVAAMERMQLYCAAHPGSPSAARQPQLLYRGQLWVA